MSVEAATEVIQYEVDGPVATIWFNRPEVKNCINWEVLMGLGALLERAENDDDVRAVVIRGRGNTFCAGADLNMLTSEFLGTTNQSVKIAQISARAVRRRGPDLPPAALHRSAQDQGAAAHRQAAHRQAVRGVGPGQRLRPGRGARPGAGRLHRAADRQERVHDAYHEARGQPRP